MQVKEKFVNKLSAVHVLYGKIHGANVEGKRRLMLSYRVACRRQMGHDILSIDATFTQPHAKLIYEQ